MRLALAERVLREFWRKKGHDSRRINWRLHVMNAEDVKTAAWAVLHPDRVKPPASSTMAARRSVTRSSSPDNHGQRMT